MQGISSGNMVSARMATVTAVAFIVAFAPVLCGLAQIKSETINGDCTADKKGKQEVNVSKPNTIVKLLCDTKDKTKVVPPFDDRDFKVCTNANCSSPPTLSKYITGATGKRDSDVTATVEIKGLPPDAKSFYVECGHGDADICYILVNVAGSKSVVDGSGQSGGPGVTSGSPLSCAKRGEAITIKIPEKGSTAQFTCGRGLTLYPLAKDSVFAEDCKKEESLKGIVRSAKANVYSLTADQKPPKKKWCYLCAESAVPPKDPGNLSNYCLVHVESSSRTQSSSAIALAAMLSCVLAMLRIT